MQSIIAITRQEDVVIRGCLNHILMTTYLFNEMQPDICKYSILYKRALHLFITIGIPLRQIMGIVINT